MAYSVREHEPMMDKKAKGKMKGKHMMPNGKMMKDSAMKKGK